MALNRPQLNKAIIDFIAANQVGFDISLVNDVKYMLTTNKQFPQEDYEGGVSEWEIHAFRASIFAVNGLIENTDFPDDEVFVPAIKTLGVARTDQEMVVSVLHQGEPITEEQFNELSLTATIYSTAYSNFTMSFAGVGLISISYDQAASSANDPEPTVVQILDVDDNVVGNIYMFRKSFDTFKAFFYQDQYKELAADAPQDLGLKLQFPMGDGDFLDVDSNNFTDLEVELEATVEISTSGTLDLTGLAVSAAFVSPIGADTLVAVVKATNLAFPASFPDPQPFSYASGYYTHNP